MTITEVHRDLFTVDDSYMLVHCIGADLRMGAGIAVPMQKKFGLRGKIRAKCESIPCPACVQTGRVCNLITKKRSSGKPTYNSLQAALYQLKEIVQNKAIQKLAMPKIGCGLDKLQWGKVREMLIQTFDDTKVEILVCVWK